MCNNVCCCWSLEDEFEAGVGSHVGELIVNFDAPDTLAAGLALRRICDYQGDPI